MTPEELATLDDWERDDERAEACLEILLEDRRGDVVKELCFSRALERTVNPGASISSAVMSQVRLKAGNSGGGFFRKYSWMLPYLMLAGIGVGVILLNVITQGVQESNRNEESRNKQKGSTEKTRIIVMPKAPVFMPEPALKNPDPVEKAPQHDVESSDLKAVKITRGWKYGEKKFPLRFFRLGMVSAQWDELFKQSGTDPFMLKLHELTGMTVAKRTEAIQIKDLMRFPKHNAPPFVYLTGKGSFVMSNEQVRLLRRYLVVLGGMLWVDGDDEDFRKSFDPIYRRLSKGMKSGPVPENDRLYFRPYKIPRSVMRWSRSGSTGRGIRHRDRLIVYYHHGNMGEFWFGQDPLATRELRDGFMMLGINLLTYAFDEYARFVHGVKIPEAEK